MLNIDYFKLKRRAKLPCQTGSAHVASAKTQLNRSNLCVSSLKASGAGVVRPNATTKRHTKRKQTE